MKKLFTGVIIGTSLTVGSPSLSANQSESQDQIFELFVQQHLDKDTPLVLSSFEKSKTKEVLNQQFSEITTKVIFSFCEEEMDVDFKKKEKSEIEGVLHTYFNDHPLCGFEGDSLQIYLNKKYADEMVMELLPYFFSKLARYYKVGVRVFVGGDDKIWKKIQKDLNGKNLEKAKKTFIGDFGSAFNKLDMAIAEKFKTTEGITIGEYVDCIMDVFPNPAFLEYISTLSEEQLALSIAEIGTLP